MKKDMAKKAIVLGITLIFVLVAFVLDVHSQVGTVSTVLCSDGDVNNRIDKNTRSRRQVTHRNKQCRRANDDKKICEPNQRTLGGIKWSSVANEKH